MTVGGFQSVYLRDKSWQIRESELVYKSRNYFLNLTLSKEEPEAITPNGVLGVDMGISSIVTFLLEIDSAERRLSNLKRGTRNLGLACKLKGQSLQVDILKSSLAERNALCGR